MPSFRFLAAAALALWPLAAQAQDNARVSLDWPGVYRAAPCAGCGGRGVWLSLEPLARHARYELVEAGERHRGAARWRPDGTRLDLVGMTPPRAVFVTENAVILGDARADPDRGRRLEKQETFRNAAERLHVDPASLRVEKGVARFRGLWNLAGRAPGGHLSLAAAFEIDCRARRVHMPQVAYYAGRFGSGRLIHEEKANDNPPQRFAGPRDVIARAAANYCPAR